MTDLLSSRSLAKAVQLTEQTAPQYEPLCRLLLLSLEPDAIATLGALCGSGPLWDGDVPSKAGRDTLLRLGLAAKIVVKSESGYQAATYRGYDVYAQRKIDE